MQTVTNVDIKQGLGKNNKPYSLYKITTSDGVLASGFEKVSVGDQVTISQNENGYNAYTVASGVSAPLQQTSPKPSHPSPNSLPQLQADATLSRIADALENIASILSKNNKSGSPEDEFVDSINDKLTDQELRI